MNADLLTLSKNESFINDGVRGTMNYSKTTGLTASSSVQATLSVAYDAGSQSYTITDGSQSKAFTPVMIQSIRPGYISYSTSNGNTTDALALSKPGSSGALRTRYVGAGFWQQSEDSATATAGTVRAFSYGVATPGGAVPRTGQANFNVDLLGVGSWQSSQNLITGSGNVIVNFTAGAISGQGSTTETRMLDDFPMPGGNWSLTAQLSSTSNGFSGTFNYGMNGSLTGRFYGPLSTEIGAIFNGTGTSLYSGTGSFTGAFIGKKVVPDGVNANLTALTVNQRFGLTASGLGYDVANGSGVGDSSSYFFNASAVTALRYLADVNGFSLIGEDALNERMDATTPGQKSDATYAVYEKVEGSTTSRLTLLRPGAANPLIKLTYLSFGSFSEIAPMLWSPGRTRSWETWFAYGIETPTSGRPTSGTANYGGVMVGYAYTGLSATPTYSISGKSAFTMNFANNALSGTLEPIGTDAAGTQHIMDKIYLSSGTMHGGMLQDAPGGLNIGVLRLGFYGPQAEEVGGSFESMFAAPGSGIYGGKMVGAFAATKCAGASPC